MGWRGCTDEGHRDSQSDDYQSLFLAQDRLIDMPARLQSWQNDRPHAIFVWKELVEVALGRNRVLWDLVPQSRRVR